MKSKLRKKMVEDLQLRGYADRTQSSYTRSVRQLENYWHLPAEEISEQRVRDYFLYCRNDAGWSAATMRIAYSGIKFFYTTTLPMEWETIKLLKIKRLSVPPTGASPSAISAAARKSGDCAPSMFLSSCVATSSTPCRTGSPKCGTTASSRPTAASPCKPSADSSAASTRSSSRYCPKTRHPRKRNPGSAPTAAATSTGTNIPRRSEAPDKFQGLEEG